MNLAITITGSFAQELHEDDIQALREDLEDELRYYGGGTIVVEVEAS